MWFHLCELFKIGESKDKISGCQELGREKKVTAKDMVLFEGSECEISGDDLHNSVNVLKPTDFFKRAIFMVHELHFNLQATF